MQIEDLGSANKTRVRDMPLSPGERLTILPGEAIAIGSTILMVQQRLPPRCGSSAARLPRAALEEECARSELTPRRLRAGAAARRGRAVRRRA